MDRLTVGSTTFRNLGREIKSMVDKLAANVSLMLPYPPSVNHYWRSCRGRVFISKAGLTYRAQVAAIARSQGQGAKPLAGRLIMGVVTHAPDNRKRDLDNVLKALLDALAKARVYNDDSQIDDLRIVRGDTSKIGFVTVEIREMVNG